MNVPCICAYICIVHTDDSIMCVHLHMKAMVYTVVGMLFSLYCMYVQLSVLQS